MASEEQKREPKACGHHDCGVSTSIMEELTFGRGDIDFNGFWQFPCWPCARSWEKRHPEDAPCWPPPKQAREPLIADAAESSDRSITEEETMTAMKADGVRSPRSRSSDAEEVDADG